MIYLCLLACLVIGSDPGSQAQRNIAQERTRLLHYCRALYPSDASAGEKRLARQYFDSITQAQLEHELVPLRKSLYRGTLSYSSVAYVLAYYGIDVEANVRRMLYALAGPSTAPQKVIEANGEGEAYECIGSAVRRIYQRHPSDTLLTLTMKAVRDSGTSYEVIYQDLVDMFFRYPAAMVRAAAMPVRSQNDDDKNSISTLAGALTQYGMETADENKEHPKYRRVRMWLSRLAKSPDESVVQAVRELRRVFEKDQK